MLIFQRGDTIIEVLLAITIFSLVSVGAMTIMNQGTNSAQRALETTLVRQQIDAQAESLRAAQKAHSASTNPNTEWSKIKADGSDTEVYDDGIACPTGVVSGSFIMDTRTAKFASSAAFQSTNDAAAAKPFAQVDYDSSTNPIANGIWIERTRITDGPSGTPEAFDFNIRACWYAAGVQTPLFIETLVRLYDPS